MRERARNTRERESGNEKYEKESGNDKYNRENEKYEREREREIEYEILKWINNCGRSHILDKEIIKEDDGELKKRERRKVLRILKRENNKRREDNKKNGTNFHSKQGEAGVYGLFANSYLKRSNDRMAGWGWNLKRISIKRNYKGVKNSKKATKAE